MTTLFHPDYYQVYQKAGYEWRVYSPSKVIYDPRPGEGAPLDKIAEYYGTSDKKVVMEFKLLTGGKEGYYLANLRDHRYYYCGSQWNDVKKKLLELGIGREK